MKVLIGGDFVINKNFDSLKIGQDLIDLFNSSDLNIVNLEAPITKSNSKLIKTGPHLKANKRDTLDTLKALQINIVTLANNHLLDYDQEGVKDTLEFCLENSIKTVGGGMNLVEASKIKYIEAKEGRIAILNFAENEWSSATESTAGANPLNTIDNVNQIKEAKSLADFVFVIIHGGHEYYNLPSPRMQKQYRFYADQGVDLIVGHHTHCISGNEVYNGIPIYYSLGNMLFTNHSNFTDWYNGIILEVTIDKNKRIKTDIVPIKQDQSNFKLEVMHGRKKEELLNRFENYSNIISDSNKLNKNWDEFIIKESLDYLSILSPKSFIRNKYLRGIIGLLGIKLNNTNGNSLLLNMLRCEAHHDLAVQVSKLYLNGKRRKSL